MEYETMSTKDIYTHFCEISRQRISQIIQKYSERVDSTVLEKMIEARQMLKERKFYDKYGHGSKISKFAKERWRSINARCSTIPAYAGCVNRFESIRSLADWGSTQKGFAEKGYDIDKDILVKGNNVYSPDTCLVVPWQVNQQFVNCTRGRERCLPIGVTAWNNGNQFVAQIATGMSGRTGGKPRYIGCYATPEEAFEAYKIEKEKSIAVLANKYRDVMEPRAYEALMNYRVEITD